jgi:hypothetical protein
VPSNPLSLMASSRQIIRTDAATNMSTNSQGAAVPVFSIDLMNVCNAERVNQSLLTLAINRGQPRPATGQGVCCCEFVKHSR